MHKSKSLFKISLASITTLHCLNRFIDSTSVISNTKPGGTYFHWKHGDLYYEKHGLGNPVLLLHDLTVFSSGYEWNQIIKDLSSNHTVYVLDMAGCGRSDKQEITYTNYFYIQMISDFVKDVIGEKTSVIATGLTGSFILSTDSIHTDLFSEIILINPNTIGYLQQIPDKRSKILMRLFSLPVIGKSVYYAATSKSNVEYYLTERCFHNPFHLNAVTTKAYYTAAHIGKGNGKALLGSIEGFYVNTDISKFLKTTTKNITLVVGEYNEKKDDIINGYTRINPNVKVELIHDSKCLPQLENAKELASLLMDCLS